MHIIKSIYIYTRDRTEGMFGTGGNKLFTFACNPSAINQRGRGRTEKQHTHRIKCKYIRGAKKYIKISPSFFMKFFISYLACDYLIEQILSSVKQDNCTRIYIYILFPL